ncbi:hypothetical protein ACFL6N_06180 [Thermodesulfobacteriota bacterium]
MEKTGNKVTMAIAGMGAAIGLWAMVAIGVGLGKADWQLSEMLRQYLVAVGAIKEFDTLVDFYTHIKGIEYIICVAFLSSFPVFFKYVNRESVRIKQ